MWKQGVTITEVQTAVTDPEAEFNGRRAIIYDASTDDLYVGNAGSHHNYVAQALGLENYWEDPDLYLGDIDRGMVRWYEAPPNKDEIEQAITAWAPEEQVTDESPFAGEDVDQLWQMSKVALYVPMEHPDDTKYKGYYDKILSEHNGKQYHIPNSVWYDAHRVPGNRREEWLEDTLASEGIPWDLADKEIQQFYDEAELVRPSKGRKPGELYHVEDVDHIHVDDATTDHPHYRWRIPVHYYPDSGEVYTGKPGNVHYDVIKPHGGKLYQGFLGIPGDNAMMKDYNPGFSWLENGPDQSHHNAVVKALTPMFPYAAQPFSFKQKNDEDDLWNLDDEPENQVPVDSRWNDKNRFPLGRVDK